MPPFLPPLLQHSLPLSGGKGSVSPNKSLRQYTQGNLFFHFTSNPKYIKIRHPLLHILPFYLSFPLSLSLTHTHYLSLPVTLDQIRIRFIPLWVSMDLFTTGFQYCLNACFDSGRQRDLCK